MELTYSSRKTGFEKGKNYRNPRHFVKPEQDVKSVVVEGDYPAVVKAYEDAKVPVKTVAAPKAKQSAKAKDSKDEGGDERRELLLNEIERITENRPAANTKTETLEKQYAELTKDQE